MLVWVALLQVGTKAANVDRCAIGTLPASTSAAVFLDTTGVEGNNSCLFYRATAVTWSAASTGCQAIPGARLLTAVRLGLPWVQPWQG